MKRLDLIIDALESCKETSWSMTFDAESVQEALAAACELRELEPVGFVIDDEIWFANEIDGEELEGTPLYALGDEK